MNDWQEVLEWPDLDAMDWQAMAEANREVMDTPQANELCLLDGFWERLISLMDVSGAAMALIDEDQKEALHAFYDRYADHMIECIKRVKAVLPIDGVLIHDDWGTQRDTMFSAATLQEMILPYLKQIVDAAHEEGVFIELHSCGKIDSFIPYVIEAGVDTWRGQANVIDKMGLVQRYGDRFKFCVEIRPAAPMPKDELLAFADEIIGQCRGKRVWLGLARLLAGEMRDALYAHVKEIGVI
jgi:hypothetical protein